MANTAPTYVNDAIASLRRHSAVIDLEGLENPTGDCFAVQARISVELPSRAKAIGHSATGVRAVETVRFEFQTTSPPSAPTIGLRSDFPLNLPHINPHTPGDYVRPCVFAGSLTELMYREGFTTVIDQVVDWLQRAASGALLNRAQGWEFMRRDEVCAIAEYDADRLAALLAPGGGIVELPIEVIHVDGAQRIHVQPVVQRPNEPRYKTEVMQDRFGHLTQIISRAFLASPTPSKLTGSRPVFGTYEPESIRSADDLIAKARDYQIDGTALLTRINEFYSSSLRQRRSKEDWPTSFQAVVILAVQRPFPLISAFGNSLELLTYLIQQDPTPGSKSIKGARIKPVIHVQSLSPQILRATSGTRAAIAGSRITWIGAGSLGSKLSLHLAKAGFTHHRFIDNDLFSPHNGARHVLPYLNNAEKMLPKAALMAAHMMPLTHQRSNYFYGSATDVLNSQELCREHLSNAKLVIDSTASQPVMEAACLSKELTASDARYARTALLAKGRICFVALEGPKRHTRVDDLMASLYAQCLSNLALRTQLHGDLRTHDELYVGQSCSSITTIMPDSVVSRAAATVALKLERWLGLGLPPEGSLSIGIEDPNDVGMQWTTLAVPPTTVISTESDGGWEIRVLSSVRSAIEAEVRQWGTDETGGAMLAHVHSERRTIIIADLVRAPSDSTRSSARFKLGIEGLSESLLKAHRDSCGYLHYIGTWHSHPTGGGLSTTDRQTLKGLAQEAQGLPTAILVWTPYGLICEVSTAA